MLSSGPDAPAIKSYASLCQRIASLYIRRKIRNGTMCPYFLGLSADDLATDCVAALFERDQCGRFPQLTVYYSRLCWEGLAEDDLLAYTRRLVFSKVNQEFCRLCKENDPALEKLMRSVRSAAKKGRAFIIRRRAGEVWLMARGRGDAAPARGVMPPEFLESQLTPLLDGGVTVQEIVLAASGILRRQREYLQGYPLTGLALVIRSAFERIAGPLEAAPEEGQSPLRSRELAQILAGSVASVRSRLDENYVRSRKMSRRAYASSFRAVMGILSAEYLSDGGKGGSFFGHLARELPGLSREEYRRTYRSRLEYFVKLTRDHFLITVRKEI